MTLPAWGNSLALSQIANEFGTSHDLGSMYSGNGHVPTGAVGFPYGTATTIPSGGTISISNFFGSTGFGNGTNLTNWWNNRSALFRTNINPNLGNYAGGGQFSSGSYTYSGSGYYNDNYTLHGGQGPSSGSTQTATPTFSWGSTGMYASVWTIVVFVNQSYDLGDTGHPGWNTTPYCPGYSGTLVNNIKINGFLCAVFQVNSGITNTPPPATCSYTWRNYSAGNNTGSALYAMAIPGAWYVSNQINNPNSGASSTYSYNLGSNQFSIFAGSDYANNSGNGLAEEINEPLSSYSSAGALINSNSSGLNSMQFQQYWWNSTANLFNFNTTGSTVTQTVNGSNVVTINKTSTTVQGGMCTAGLGVIFIFSQG